MEDVYTIITGALGGIGSAFALECARRGRNLLLVDIHEQADDLVGFLLNQFQIKIQYHPCDLTDHSARAELIHLLNHQQIKLNGLINVVGKEIEGAFIDRSREEILHLIKLNIEALIDLSLAALKLHDDSQHFFLVNVASLAGFFPMPYKSLYAATKRFIINFSLGLREEIREFGNVTVLCPSGLPTTAESMRKIFLQGFWGKITAQETYTVVRRTMDKVQRNVPIYIPGFPNKLIAWFANLLPDAWIAAYLRKRWGEKQVHLDLWQIVDKNHRYP